MTTASLTAAAASGSPAGTVVLQYVASRVEPVDRFHNLGECLVYGQTIEIDSVPPRAGILSHKRSEELSTMAALLGILQMHLHLSVQRKQIGVSGLSIL